MKEKETAIEVKVGALVLLALAIFGLFIVIIGGVKLPGQSARIFIDYETAAGIKPGASVRLSGIEIGSVKAVTYEGGHYDETLGRPVYVRVTASVDASRLSLIKQDAEFGIASQGLLGEPGIEITSYLSDAPSLENGDIVRGLDPPSMARVFQTVADSLDGLKILVDRLNEIEGAGTPIKIDELVNNVGSLAGSLDERIRENSDEIDSIFEDVAGILDENRDKLPPIFDNVEGLTAEFEQLGASLNHGLGRGQSLRSILENADTTLETVARDIDPIMTSAKDALENVDGILEENREGIKRAVDNLAAVSDDVEGITSKIESGEGTIGRLLADEEIFEDVREFIRELKRRPWRVIWKE